MTGASNGGIAIWVGQAMPLAGAIIGCTVWTRYIQQDSIFRRVLRIESFAAVVLAVVLFVAPLWSAQVLSVLTYGGPRAHFMLSVVPPIAASATVCPDAAAALVRREGSRFTHRMIRGVAWGCLLLSLGLAFRL